MLSWGGDLAFSCLAYSKWPVCHVSLASGDKQLQCISSNARGIARILTKQVMKLSTDIAQSR